ncbi:GH25 family lysozyme [Streptomyces sp. NPDC026659]|uniref:GH25 family lysozyme n=1 Tax=Streptomyces sp. NPDC026659 TaxID=3155123 RepID=UPI0034114FA7
MADLIKGVDVAAYQSSTYDLKGLDFVFVKATEGTSYANPKMPAQVARAREAGLVTGFYHFQRKGNPEAQAAYFVSRAGARPGEILACDWESAPDGTYPSNEEKDRFIRECKRLAPTQRVVLYCNTSFWLTHDKTSYAGDGLWIADPSSPIGQPRIKHAWLYHQYSSAGGIDRDVANFPSRDALRTWANGLRPATPDNPTTGGGSVALTAQQTFDAVWKTDQVAAPDTAPDRATNATWQPQSWLKDTGNRVRVLEAELSAVRAIAAANNAALKDVAAKLDALTSSLAQLDVSGALGALQAAINATTITLHSGEVRP